MNEHNDNFSIDMNSLLSIAYREKHHDKDTFLFKEGDMANDVYIVKTGKVRIGRITPDGRELTYRICHPDDIIAESPFFCAQSAYTVHAKVIENGTFLRINKRDMEKKLLEDPQLSSAMIKLMGLYHQKNQSKFRDLILHGKKGALYSTLIRMSNSYGLSKEDGILIDLPQTNQELANFCGMTREVVNRLLSALKKDGIISIEDGKILIHDLQYLKNEINCENCPIHICNID